MGFSLQWFLLLQGTGSRMHRLQLLWLLRGMWDLPRSGIEPVFPALAGDIGGFFITEPPGKPLMWTIFKVFVEFVPILLLFYVLILGGLQGMWDLSSLTRDQTCTPCLGRQSLNHWTTRELPKPPLTMEGKRVGS